ncbi:MAG: hypothetical protein ACI9D5_001085 [Candidatus Endobugula sp.]
MNIIVKKIIAFLQYGSKNRAAKELLQLSDKQLIDVGLCSAKLSKGASAYPWRLSTADVVDLARAQPKAAKFVVEDRKNIAA